MKKRCSPERVVPIKSRREECTREELVYRHCSKGGINIQTTAQRFSQTLIFIPATLWVILRLQDIEVAKY
jgi:hypothetical protein